MFKKDEEYRRIDLHKKYGGQRQGGISTPSEYPVILLFTSTTGEQYGYRDDLTADGYFLYTGEGQIGDMQFIRGNKAIRDHEKNGKELYLFEYFKRGYVRCIGKMICDDYEEKRGPDVEGNMRKIIVFRLRAVIR